LKGKGLERFLEFFEFGDLDSIKYLYQGHLRQAAFGFAKDQVSVDDGCYEQTGRFPEERVVALDAADCMLDQLGWVIVVGHWIDTHRVLRVDWGYQLHFMFAFGYAGCVVDFGKKTLVAFRVEHNDALAAQNVVGYKDFLQACLTNTCCAEGEHSALTVLVVEVDWDTFGPVTEVYPMSE